MWENPILGGRAFDPSRFKSVSSKRVRAACSRSVSRCFFFARACSLQACAQSQNGTLPMTTDDSTGWEASCALSHKIQTQRVGVKPVKPLHPVLVLQGHQAVDLALLGGLGGTSHRWPHGTMVPTGAAWIWWVFPGPRFSWDFHVGRWPKWPKIMANHWFIMV